MIFDAFFDHGTLIFLIGCDDEVVVELSSKRALLHVLEILERLDCIYVNTYYTRPIGRSRSIGDSTSGETGNGALRASYRIYSWNIDANAPTKGLDISGKEPLKQPDVVNNAD